MKVAVLAIGQVFVKRAFPETVMPGVLPTPFPGRRGGAFNRTAWRVLQVITGLQETERIGVSLLSEKYRGLMADTQVKREMSALGPAYIPGQGKTQVAVSHGADVIPPKKELLCGYVLACPGRLTRWTTAPGQTGATGGGSDSERLQKGQNKCYRKMFSTNLPSDRLPSRASSMGAEEKNVTVSEWRWKTLTLSQTG